MSDTASKASVLTTITGSAVVHWDSFLLPPIRVGARGVRRAQEENCLRFIKITVDKCLLFLYDTSYRRIAELLTRLVLMSGESSKGLGYPSPPSPSPSCNVSIEWPFGVRRHASGAKKNQTSFVDPVGIFSSITVTNNDANGSTRMHQIHSVPFLERVTSLNTYLPHTRLAHTVCVGALPQVETAS